MDAVAISHNHYDHLDLPSIQRVEAVFKPHFFVPLGMKRWFMYVIFFCCLLSPLSLPQGEFISRPTLL